MQWPPAPITYAYQRVDARGFIYCGAKYDDYGDRPDLPSAVRCQIARWARAVGTATPSQLRLAELPDEEPVRDAVADWLDFDHEFLSSPTLAAIMSHLSEDEQSRLLRPMPFFIGISSGR